MKKLFTLATAATLGFAALGAQAQAITVDGQLTTTEVSATGYTLVGRFTGTHGFAPSATNSAGIMALYAAADATNLYFFVAATLQNDGSPATISNSLQVLVARPGVTGVPVGTALPKPTGSTSFQGFGPYLDQVGDMGIGIKGTSTAAQIQVDGVVYAGGTTPTATAAVLSPGLAATGAVAAVTGQTGSLTVFNGAQVAYRTSTSLNTNPGYASNGNAPANGLEIAVSRASIGLPATGGTVRLFALQNNASGDYVSSDFIPQNTAALPATFTATPNLGANPDFRLVPGTQSAALTVGAATGVTVLATKAADAASVALSVYPNPVADAASVAYRVTDQASPVSIVLTDLLGRPVRVLENSTKPVGSQSATLDKSNLAAGTYLVRVQVGEKVSTSKIAVL